MKHRDLSAASVSKKVLRITAMKKITREEMVALPEGTVYLDRQLDPTHAAVTIRLAVKHIGRCPRWLKWVVGCGVLTAHPHPRIEPDLSTAEHFWILDQPPEIRQQQALFDSVAAERFPTIADYRWHEANAIADLLLNYVDRMYTGERLPHRVAQTQDVPSTAGD